MDDPPLLSHLEGKVDALIARLDSACEEATRLRQRNRQLAKEHRRLQEEHRKVCESNSRAKSMLERLLNQLPPE